MKTTEIKVTELFIYPLKSARPVALKKMSIVDTGPQYDRQWMLITAEGEFVSQRTFPQMCMIGQQVSQDSLQFSASGFSDLKVPLDLTEGEKTDCQIFADTTAGTHLSKEFDAWFSEVLKTPVQLVRVPTNNSRTTPAKYDSTLTPVSFADAFPFLLASHETLDELNSKLSSPVPMNRFRPNIVVQGAPAGEEDNWGQFTIGNVEFSGIKDCSRCSIITVDQSSGEKDNSPMTTLMKYRKRNNKVVFGQNLIHHCQGDISVGDQLFIKEL